MDCAAQVPPRDGVGVLLDFLNGSLGDDSPAKLPCAGTHIDNMIGRIHGFFIVLHHQKRVPQVPQALQGCEKPLVIALVEPDAGLVKYIQDPHKPGTYLGCQPDALCFPAGEGSRRTGKGQVIQAHIHQELQPCADLFEDLPGYRGIPGSQLQLPEEIHTLLDRHEGDLMDILSPHSDGQAFFFQPLPLACRTVDLAHE